METVSLSMDWNSPRREYIAQIMVSGYVNYRVCMLAAVLWHRSYTHSHNIVGKKKANILRLAKLLNKIVIFHFHPSNEKFLFEPDNKALYHKLFSEADLILVLSRQWQRWINDALGLQDKIQVLYNPCPKVARRADLRKNHILFAGTIIPRKGYETLLRGFAIIADKYPQWTIVLPAMAK